ncbi:hypothetical protein [Saliphagus infecundisoli]|uniref:DUF8159 domain-containing protein n=1 Tax=Saliphagus infecundisoli TaxID=1849069 RepID=A0ABD5QKM5_9EURY|nr:hypothetical protein [Saliphagus infecundisoli]
MTLITYIPGMAPGRTQRNLVVLGVYLVCFPVVPFIFAYAVFSNYNRISDRLAMRNTPGFTPGGGAKPAAVTLVALLVTISVIASLSVAPFLVLGDNGGSDIPTEDDSGIEGDDTPVGDDEGEDDADDTDSNGFDGGEFIGESDPQEEISEEEREENTLEAFQEMLTDEGYEVTDGRMEDGVMYIEYRTYAEDRAEIDGEITNFAEHYTAYDDILQNEMTEEYESVFVERTERLHVTIVDYNDVEQGSYYIEGEWARAFYAGEMSDEEYGDRIEETVEISDEFDDNRIDDSSDDDSGDSSD